MPGAQVFQSCLSLCDPMDYSPPGSSVHGVLQARIPEWVPRPPQRGGIFSHLREKLQVSYRDPHNILSGDARTHD